MVSGDKNKGGASGAGKLFSSASKVPLVTWLHMLPIVGMVFGPFDVMRAAKQAEQIENLTLQVGTSLARDMTRAVASGRLAPPRAFAGGSTEFSSLNEQLARHAQAKHHYVARLKPVQTHALHAQRAIALHGASGAPGARPNLVHSTFRASQFLRKTDSGQ
jgi:hypothetical protein